MKQKMNCGICSKEFVFQSHKNRIRKFCSVSCRMVFINDRCSKWNKLTELERLDNYKKIYESQLIKKEGCWSWKGRSLTKDGETRGLVSFCNRTMFIHRLSWVLTHGPILNGLLVLHKCDNSICSNPDHLFLGTQSDNMRDKILKKRHYNQKLTVDDVLKIRQLLESNIKVNHLAQQFNVTPMTIRDVKFRRSWNYI